MITVPLRSGASCILFRGHGAALTIRYHPIACHGNLSRRLLYITNDAGADISASSRYGLLGLGMYRCPDDFITRAHEVVAKCRLIRQRVNGIDPIGAPPRFTLEHLDEVSRQICSVIDSAEFTRNAHQDHTYQMAADRAFEDISKLIHELNADSCLYDKLISIPAINKNKNDDTTTSATLHQSSNVKDMRSEICASNALPVHVEDSLFAADLRREFEADGVHLSNERKAELAALQERVMMAEMQFGRLIREADKMLFTVSLPSHCVDLCSAIREWLQHVPQHKMDGANYEDPLVVTVNVQACQTLLCSVDDEPARKAIFFAMRNALPENESALGEVLLSRYKLATFLGYKSYAHKYLANKVFKTPSDVMQCLRSLNTTLHLKGESEYESMVELKRTLDNQTNVEPVGDIVSLWDIPYLSSRLATTRQTEDKTSAQLSRMDAYFSIDSVLEGISMILNELFGLSVYITSDFAPDEAWCQTKAPDQSPLLYKCRITRKSASDCLSQTEVDVAVLYLDLFARSGKMVGPAHYNIRASCTNINPGENVVSKSLTTRQGTFLSYEQRENPVIVVTMNLKHPSHIQTQDPKPCCLSYGSLQTLYHELGHSLHTILSATHYQHLSGTRGPVDFAEIPSHLFEYFARDPRVLALWAKHYVTAEPIPADLLRAVEAEKSPHAAIGEQIQLLYAAIDQSLFGTDIDYSNDPTPHDVYLSACRVASRLHREFLRGTYALPVANTTSNSEDISAMDLKLHHHFLGYGGGYYCYRFSQMCAAQLWERHFMENPLSRQAGMLLYEKFLSRGAAVTAADLFDEGGLLGSTVIDPRLLHST